MAVGIHRRLPRCAGCPALRHRPRDAGVPRPGARLCDGSARRRPRGSNARGDRRDGPPGCRRHSRRRTGLQHLAHVEPPHQQGRVHPHAHRVARRVGGHRPRHRGDGPRRAAGGERLHRRRCGERDTAGDDEGVEPAAVDLVAAGGSGLRLSLEAGTTGSRAGRGPHDAGAGCGPCGRCPDRHAGHDQPTALNLTVPSSGEPAARRAGACAQRPRAARPTGARTARVRRPVETGAHLRTRQPAAVRAATGRLHRRPGRCRGRRSVGAVDRSDAQRRRPHVAIPAGAELLRRQPRRRARDARPPVHRARPGRRRCARGHHLRRQLPHVAAHALGPRSRSRAEVRPAVPRAAPGARYR